MVSKFVFVVFQSLIFSCLSHSHPPSLVGASDTADTLFQEVLGRKDKADSTRNALNVLQRFKFLFNLPLNIERNIQKVQITTETSAHALGTSHKINTASLCVHTNTLLMLSFESGAVCSEILDHSSRGKAFSGPSDGGGENLFNSLHSQKDCLGLVICEAVELILSSFSRHNWTLSSQSLGTQIENSVNIPQLL